MQGATPPTGPTYAPVAPPPQHAPPPPPPPPSHPHRFAQLLEDLRLEGEKLIGDNKSYLTVREEYARKVDSHHRELSEMEAAYHELSRKHEVMSQKYEEEINQLKALVARTRAEGKGGGKGKIVVATSQGLTNGDEEGPGQGQGGVVGGQVQGQVQGQGQGQGQGVVVGRTAGMPVGSKGQGVGPPPAPGVATVGTSMAQSAQGAQGVRRYGRRVVS